MTDDAWSNFIASINPVELESERMRVHGDLDHERPGSRWDHEMRHAHDYCRRDFWERMRDDVTAEQAALQLADADREIHARGYDIPDETEIDAAIRSYAIRQAARAAERKAA